MKKNNNCQQHLQSYKMTNRKHPQNRCDSHLSHRSDSHPYHRSDSHRFQRYGQVQIDQNALPHMTTAQSIKRREFDVRITPSADKEKTNKNRWKQIKTFYPIIIGTNFWKLLAIIVQRKNKPLAATPKRESPSAMDYKKQMNIIRLILSTNYNDRN